ncbi:MAG TPA: hypothetical protein VHO26_02115 [Propionibacteriaceae bacterium]|nr:hypothetical protein [Propionibacteriaceae bacterium]
MSTASRSPLPLVGSLVICALVLGASLAGLLSPGIYARETANWVTQARGQDLGNLVAVVFLLVSAVMRFRGSVVAGRIWLGTLLYLVYAYVVYAMAVHFNRLFLVYVAVQGLSAYAAMLAVGRLRSEPVAVRPGVPRRVAGFTLLVTGVLFALLWLSEVVPAVVTGVAPRSLTDAGLVANPIHVLDLALVLPAFVATGVGALRGRRTGLFWGAPWLTFSVLMGASIVFAMVLATASGTPGTLPPLVLVSLVTLASGAALWFSLEPGAAGGGHEPRGPRVAAS